MKDREAAEEGSGFLSFWRSSLLGRLLLALLLVSLVPLLGVNLMLSRVYRPAMTDQTLGTHSLVARNSADRVAGVLSVQRSIAAAVANNPEVARNPDSPAVQGLLAGVLQSQSEVMAIRLVDAAGEVILNVRRRDFAEEIDRVLALKPSTEVTAFVGELTVWIRRDIGISGGGGAVQLVSAAGILSEIFRPEGLLQHSEMVLVDAEGGVIAGSVPNLDGFPPRIIERALGGAIQGTETVETEGRELLAAYQSVAGSPWMVISVQPRETAEGMFRQMRRTSWIAIALSILLTGLLASGAYGSVVRPIRRLVRDQRRLVGLSPEPRSGSEIDQLQNSFDVLQRRLREQEAIGKVFLGRYQVLEVLGEGGMGTVFRGWDPKLQRPVALKTFRLAEEMEPEERGTRVAKLLEEAVATARVQAPNVVAVFDVVEHEDVAFMAMEFVDGLSLEDYLKMRLTLSPEEVATLALAVYKGLVAAHDEGIVHHDVKPGNILLSRDGSIKVMDFGIAKFLSAMADQKEKVFGTPGYLPPEALRGRGYTETGDFFALGVVMYQCLVGRRPFTGKTIRDVLVSSLTDDPVPPRVLDSRIPKELSDLVIGLLAKEVDHRTVISAQLEETLESLPKLKEWTLDWSSKNEEVRIREEELHSRYCPTQLVSDSVG